MNNLYTKSRIVQLKTIIGDLGQKTRTYNVESAAKRFNEQLKLAQEEYKSLTGEYVKEWMPVDENAAKDTGFKEMSIDSLLEQLGKLKGKGAKNIQYKGTLMCEEDGNAIIASTESQM